MKYQDMDQWSALPEKCAATNPTTGETILIKRGELGYYPFPGKDADKLNARWGVDEFQVQAMEIGSCFGWSVPGAHPKVYELEASKRGEL